MYSRNFQTDKSRNDRFIPRRLENIPIPCETNEAKTFQTDSCINLAKKGYFENNYKTLLKETLFPTKRRILNFFSPKKRQSDPCPFFNNWPVKPRQKPIISMPIYVLDLPDFNSLLNNHAVDWSSQGCIASIFENEVYMWFPGKKDNITITSTNKKVQCSIKWNLDGTRLAMGLKLNFVGIWDAKTNKVLFRTSCCMSCNVLRIVWMSENCLITGCSKGTLTMYSKYLLKTKIIFAHNDSIINLALSCNNNYLVTSSLDNRIRVWKMATLKGHVQLNCSSPALTWHPWQESLLAIGLDCVTLWNVNSKKQIISCVTDKQTTIDCLSFNPISGELVVSFFNLNQEISKIIVLSNLHRIVEELYFHEGRIFYFLWGDGGKRLGSAGSDENLCIWDFFGTKINEKKKTVKNKGNLIVENVNFLEFCIR